MADTYSSSLRLIKQTVGANSDLWGTYLNTLIDLVDDSVAGRSAVTHDDTANYSLTTANNSADESRRAILNIGGALTANRNVVCPTLAKVYIAKNATTGGFIVTLKTTAGTGIAIPSGKTMLLFCDATNVVNAIDYLTALTVATLVATTYNGNTITTGTGILTIAASKTLTVSNSIAFAGTDSTTMTFPPASANIGYLGIPQNSKSAAYTTVLADAGKHILHPTADNNARVFTIDSNANVAYEIGTAITFVNEINTVTISITSDTLTQAGSGSTGSRTLAANGMATAIKTGTTSWKISGVGLT